MASTSTAAAKEDVPPRRLSELLQEEQEPFVLELYLLERGCRRRSLELEGRFSFCSSTNSSSNRNKELSKVLKRSSSYHGSSSTSTSSGQFSSIARSFYSKIASINQVIGLKGLNKGRKKKRSGDGKERDAEAGRFSSASCSTSCISCSESDLERDCVVSSAMNATGHEEGPDRVMTQWRFIEDNKQCSPVSVLDGIDFLQDIPVYNNVRQEETPSTSRTRFHKKVSEDSILSATLFDLLVQSRRSKPEKETFPLQMNSRKALQQTRQLLFDCVQEVVSSEEIGKQQISRMKRKQKGLIMGPEEIGKMICNNLKMWGKLSTDETNIVQLLQIDLLSTTEEWGRLEVYRRDVPRDIGDSILEDITDDIVRDMFDQH